MTTHPTPTVEEIERWLQERIGRRTDLAPEDIDPERPFSSFGLESKDAVAISGELETWLGRTLDPTVAYEQPTARALARFLVHGEQRGPERPRPRRESYGGPIAVIGMACRFPGGVTSADSLWQLLVEGRDGAREVPPQRWNAADYFDPDPGAPGKAYTQVGGFLDDLEGFDAQLFGLSPAEALRMDPQQRMLLELAWAALEDAALAPDRLRGSVTGVFVGLMDTMQYARLQLEATGPELLSDPFFAMGAAASVAAGRISYLLDLRGPAIPVDTACSSSLVSVHLAARSLREGQCDLALAGGASAVVHPQALVQACKMGMLARDGRCKTFDEAADGFLIGEGSGVVVLERLEDAVDAGHPVAGVIEGTAVNQDGRSNGLNAPSRAAQADVIRGALADARVEADAIDYVEAHGSGTALGDAIEVGALRDVFGDRPEPLPPVKLGSVKTNVGHLQGAAGVAGLIKAILSVSRAEVPPTLHLSTPNPALKLDGRPLAAATERCAWPRSLRPRRAGVSSFGWSGTNAHAVVRAAPQRASRAAATDDDWHVLPLSAATPAALVELGRRLSERLKSPDAPAIRDAAFTLSVGRSALSTRAAVLCRDRDAALDRLAALAVAAPSESRETRRVALGLTGSAAGADSRDLYDSEPAFRASLDGAFEAATERLDMSTQALANAAFGGPEESMPIRRVAACALDYGYAGLLRRWGIEPSALLGAWVGEYAAASVAGLVSLDDALALAAQPGRAPSELGAAAIPCVSAALGGRLSSEASDWPEALEPTRLGEAVEAVADAADVLVATGDAGAFLADDGTVPRVLAAGCDRRSLLGVLAELWEGGAAVDWAAVFEGDERPRRVRLPTYPFQHTRFWPDAARSERSADGDGKRPDLADWGSVGVWRHALPAASSGPPHGPWLVLADDREIADALRAAGCVVTAVARGEQLEVNAGGVTTIDPTRPEHYVELLDRLAATDTAPTRVIHSWAGPAQGADIDAGFVSLLLLGQAIARREVADELELVVATTNAMRVLGDDAGKPSGAMLASACLCLSAELPNVSCRYVDLSGDSATAAEQLAAELALAPTTDPVAWRAGRRWVRRHEPVRLEPGSSPPWRERGVYAITGGLGSLGLVLARHLAARCRARLVLVGRTVPSGIAERTRELEQLGAEVVTAKADVGDPREMQAVVEVAKERFGALNGVVHLAGVPGGGLLATKTQANALAVLRPKVLGTLALAEALQGESLDVLALYSSSTAVLGGLGEFDYAAANAFMDAWADIADGQLASRVVSIGWGAWQRDTWQEKVLAEAPELAKRARDYRTRFGIADDEGMELLERIISSPLSSVTVLPQDAETTMRTIAALADADALVVSAPRQLFPRPDLRWPYKQPRSETERRLATIWSEQLGIDRVGLDDPFFELGGTSLVALAILARIERDLGATLLAGNLFERPTVRELAALIDGSHDDRVAEHVDAQSDRGERRRQLAQRSGRRRRATGPVT